MMKVSIICLMLAMPLTIWAQDVDYEIEGDKGKEIVLSVSGFADEGKSQLSVMKTYGDDDFSVSDFEDGKISFLFNSPNEYVFDFWETLGECKQNTTVRFKILKDIELYIPNIFTPDGDGINDQFHIKYDSRPDEFNIVIFNREGRKMFTSGNPDFHWDGSRCTPGVYSYRISYSYRGRQKNLSGFITLADRR
ncbi:MAG: gliding motility-associated C-terminal domain-containing protein [Bacteroidales bacterium]|nr:gliding motility-associated C-terminal domain-containing protein [Bacteroidales bacterium]